MNRREYLSALTAGLASAGVAGEVQAIDAESPPILLVVRLSVALTKEARGHIRQSLEAVFGDRPHPPIVVVPPDMEIEAVLDPRQV